jgi:hypothetical protein
MTIETTTCSVARERFAPGKNFSLAAFAKHAQSCTECGKFVRSVKRAQRTRTRYSRDFPLTGDVHRYLLIVPQSLWDAAAKRATRENVSMRSVLNKLLAGYAEHGLPS